MCTLALDDRVELSEVAEILGVSGSDQRVLVAGLPVGSPLTLGSF